MSAQVTRHLNAYSLRGASRLLIAVGAASLIAVCVRPHAAVSSESNDQNTVLGFRPAAAPELKPGQVAANAASAEIELELGSNRDFGARDAVPVLTIGNKRYMKSRFGEDGSTDRLIFLLPRQDFGTRPGAGLSDSLTGLSRALRNDRVHVEYDGGRAEERWDFTAPDRRKP